MVDEEYLDMQEHLLYITGLITKDLNYIKNFRGVTAIWDELENTAKITFYYDREVSEKEMEDFSVANAEIIAHCSNARLEEKFIRLDYPKHLPSQFLAYKKDEK
ncbi:MAG: hypothetical protein ACH350_10340 [Parachlamydiaceae bacterium]